MAAVLYMILAWYAGLSVVKRMMPYISKINQVRCLTGRQVNLDKWIVNLPGSFLTGTLIMTWVTYLAAYIFKNTEDPLFFGNIVSIILFLLFALRKTYGSKHVLSDMYIKIKTDFYSFIKHNCTELIFIIVVTALWTVFMFRSFSISGNTMYVGYSVFSDFGPHLSVIRSFSLGSNFPSEYPHFAGSGMRYHFMFQFLAGNLEYLGMPLDWAFNLPSIISIVSFHMLLYSLAIILFNSKLTALLTSVFFFFRSSFAFFTYSGQFKNLREVGTSILKNEEHIGKTLHENWGLWAQKVYVNQRHFSFALGILILILIAMLPLFRKMLAHLAKAIKESFVKDETYMAESGTATKSAEKSYNTGMPGKNSLLTVYHARINSHFVQGLYYRAKLWLREFVFTADGWLPLDLKRSITTGVVLGLLSFWNGAVVIACLGILLVIAACSKHRLEFLIIAAITVTLSYAESIFFIGLGSSAVEPKLTIGFLSGSKNLLEIIKYYIELLGILPFVVISALFMLPKGGRILTLAFFSPILLASTLQVTPDITVNHKYVIIGTLLLGSIAAYFIDNLLKARKFATILTASLLITVMIITGVVDIITLINLDKHKLEYKTDDPVSTWVINNTDPHEIFLTHYYSLDPILLAGRKLFYGWPYYAWSAGYNTDEREAAVRQIYGADNIDDVRNLIKKYNISYIVVENENRNSNDYKLNERLIDEHFSKVYIGSNNYIIYKTD